MALSRYRRPIEYAGIDPLRESRNLKPQKLILKTRDSFSRKFAPPKITRYTVYRFPHTIYPNSSCICSFLQQHPYFQLCFSFLFQYFFVIKFYVLNHFFAQYKHTYGQLRVSNGSHMKAAHTVLYMKKHTQTYASYPAMDISCMSVV